MQSAQQQAPFVFCVRKLMQSVVEARNVEGGKCLGDLRIRGLAGGPALERSLNDGKLIWNVPRPC
jgi:hypothetical protein